MREGSPWQQGHPQRDIRASQPVPPLPTPSSCRKKGKRKSVGCLESRVFAGLLRVEQPQFAKDQVVLQYGILWGSSENKSILQKGPRLLLPHQGMSKL